MAAALTFMAEQRSWPKIAYEVLLIPATDVSVTVYDTVERPEVGSSKLVDQEFRTDFVPRACF